MVKRKNEEDNINMGTDEDDIDMETDNPSQEEGKSADTRCSPGCVVQLIQVLPEEAKKRLIELGFDQLLKLKLDGLHFRPLLADLLRTADFHSDSQEIEFCISNMFSLWVNTEVVRHVIPMPDGCLENFPVSDPVDTTKEYQKMVKALIRVLKKYPEEYNVTFTKKGSKAGTLPKIMRRTNSDVVFDERNLDRTVENMEALDSRSLFLVPAIDLLFRKFISDPDVSSELTIDSLVRLFLGVVLQKLLLPSCSAVVTKPVLESVYDLENMKRMDWGHLVFKHLWDGVKAFPATNRMDGCIAVLLVSSCCKYFFFHFW